LRQECHLGLRILPILLTWVTRRSRGRMRMASQEIMSSSRRRSSRISMHTREGICSKAINSHRLAITGIGIRALKDHMARVAGVDMTAVIERF